MNFAQIVKKPFIPLDNSNQVDANRRGSREPDFSNLTECIDYDRLKDIRMTANSKKERERMLAKLTKSKAYRIAYRDKDFLASEKTRHVRLQLELLKPELIFREHNIISTIVTFGGTRILEPREAGSKVAAIKNRLSRTPNDKVLKKRLAIARAVERKSKYYDEAREFARIVSSECQLRDRTDYVIVTGGGPGIMEAANRGAHDVGAKSIGLNITLPLEQDPNPYITPELCLQFHYFAIRKMHFMLRAKALLAFPGGYGTLDELFEALTLVQTKKVEPLPIVLFGEKFWRAAINFEYLVDEGTIAQEDLNLFFYADTARDAWAYIKEFWKKNNNHSKD